MTDSTCDGQAVTDSTGREDLLVHLRKLLLQQTAARHGYGRLATGDSATCLAVRAVSLAAKGCGYALPGELQYIDARRVTDGRTRAHTHAHHDGAGIATDPGKWADGQTGACMAGGADATVERVRPGISHASVC
jgi:hypothetical protein